MSAARQPVPTVYIGAHPAPRTRAPVVLALKALHVYGLDAAALVAALDAPPAL